MRVAQPSIIRSAQAGHGRTLNVHRQSKGENINQNYDWMRGQPYGQPAGQQQQAAAPPQKPAKPAPAKKPSQQPANTSQDDGSVSSGTAKNAVNGKDLATTGFRFNDKSTDYSIEQVIKAQGFDGKPTITSDIVAFDAACKASNFVAKRGVGASDQATLDAYNTAMKTGDFYVKCSGGSAHGYGMYCASLDTNIPPKTYKSKMQSAISTAQSYAANKVSTVYTFTLDKSAKVSTESALKRQMKNDTEFQKVCQASKMKSYYTQDVGVYAAYKGYDAYVAGSGRSGHGSDYTVVLNRSKVIMLDESGIPQF